MTLRIAALRRRRNPFTTATATDPASKHLRPPRSRARPKMTLLTIAIVVIVIYIISLLLLTFSPRAQYALIFLNILAPPSSSPIGSLTSLASHRLASTARHTSTLGGLRGFHLLPPGPSHALPPAAPPRERDAFFDAALSAPRGRVVLFFHGNAGHRAFPVKRMAMLRLLGAHLDAHVVTFDYAGFGDSPGAPSEAQLYADAVDSFAWVAARVAPDADVLVYGQSLGTFAAVYLTAALFPAPGAAGRLLPARGGGVLRGVVLDAPPSSVVDATMTHPSTRLYKMLPGSAELARWMLKDNGMNSVQRLAEDVGEGAPPMLVLHGKEDSMVAIEQGRSVAKAAESAGIDVRLVEFEGVGHVNVNGAENFLLELRQFVERVFPGGLVAGGIL